MTPRESSPAWRGNGPDHATEEAWLGRAIQAAQCAAQTGDVPVGAVVIGPEGAEMGAGWNQREALSDPTAHAEIVALREASRHLGRWRLDDCAIAVTLEPCLMCAGAIAAARVPLVVFGAWDVKAGACGSVWDVLRDPAALHRAETRGGIRAEETGRLLADFFAHRRI